MQQPIGHLHTAVPRYRCRWRHELQHQQQRERFDLDERLRWRLQRWRLVRLRGLWRNRW